MCYTKFLTLLWCFGIVSQTSFISTGKSRVFANLNFYCILLKTAIIVSFLLIPLSCTQWCGINLYVYVRVFIVYKRSNNINCYLLSFYSGHKFLIYILTSFYAIFAHWELVFVRFLTDTVLIWYLVPIIYLK